jgi:hypothetical protein
VARIEVFAGSGSDPMTALDGLTRSVLLCRDYVSDLLTDEELCQHLQSVRILCVSDLENLSSYSGQTALVTLVLLLSRMGMQVGLRIPEVEMLGPQPPLTMGPLRAALLALSGKLIVGTFVRHDVEFQPDIIFVLGDTEFDSRHLLWRLNGDDWTGSLKMSGSRSESRPWQSNWTGGSMISAALAANEAFKFAMRSLPLRDQTSQIFFEPSRTCIFNFGKISIPQEIIDLGRVDVISAGAISQSALYALLRFPNARMSGRIFDNDITAESNLNRNMLTVKNDIGTTKVQLVADVCADQFQLQPIGTRFAGTDYQTGELAPRVLIGVDDIPSRWEVQRRSSGWLAVGGTSHFSISSSDHSPGEPCCGCLHPVDDLAGGNPIPTISFVSFWAGLATAVRLLRQSVGHPYGRDQQHLWLTPLRLDQPHAAMWMRVAPADNCPVCCPASFAMK